ncbi:YncE family protein [Dyella subtropica]|uniref:YncE family protein n=1 Tax=Dyella subtropica TaxID=2992127 RepID=UPI002258F3C6|nr:YncE family protein [Dyella subtropica]
MTTSSVLSAALSATLLTIGIAAAIPAHAATPSYAIQQRHELGGEGGWDYLSLDSASHRLFIARNDRVMVVDANSGKLVGEIPGMQHAHGVALAAAQHRGYVSNGKGDNVSVIDLDALKVVGQIPVSGKNPDAIVFDGNSGHVLTMNGRSNNISVIDPAAGKEVATIALSGKPEFAVVDGKGNLFVNLEDTSQLVHVDLKAGKVADTWKLAPCDSPSGLAYDAANQRLFSVCDNQLMVVTDARDGHQVAKLPIGKGPDAAEFDPQAKLAFSSNSDGTLTVIQQTDADHYTVAANVPTQKGARTMALDAQQHRIYLVAANPAAKGAPVTGFTVLVAGAH